PDGSITCGADRTAEEQHGRNGMTHKLLQVVLVLFGIVTCLVYPLALVWPSGWAWHHGSPASSHYFMMIVGVYGTLGIFLFRAAANPAGNRSLIWFTVWSSVVHRVIMRGRSLAPPGRLGNRLGAGP